MSISVRSQTSQMADILAPVINYAVTMPHMQCCILFSVGSILFL